MNLNAALLKPRGDVEYFLGAPQREARNERHAAAVEGLLDRLAEAIDLIGVPEYLVFAELAVGGFNDQRIHADLFGKQGVPAHQFLLRFADITRVVQRVIRRLDENRGAAQHVSGVVERHLDGRFRVQTERAFILVARDRAHREIDVAVLVQWVALDAPLPRDQAHDRDTVVQHAVHDPHRRNGGVGAHGGKLAEQIRHGATMILVRVRDQQRVGRAAEQREGGQCVAPILLRMGSAVQQYPVPVDTQFKATGADLSAASQDGQ